MTLPNAASCTDGDACTDGDGCANKACGPGKAKVCDDGNGCTDDGCDKVKGCVYLANAVTCSDGDACTGGDACAGSACKGGAAVKCDDGNVCTTDGCDPGKGCAHAGVADGTACAGGVCAAGACKALCDLGPVVYGDAATDGFNGLATRTGSPGALLAGRRDSTTNGVDGWLLRVDGNATKVWEKLLATDGADYAVSVCAHPSGDWIWAGSRVPTGGQNDAWAGRIDDKGNVVWDKSFATTGEDNFFGMAVADDGKIWAAGDTGANGASCGKDARITRIGVNGVVELEKQFGSACDYFRDVVPQQDGGAIVVGTILGGAGYDAWAVRMDAKGAKVWEQIISSSEHEYFYRAIADGYGGILAVGGAGPEGGKTQMFAARFSASGNIVWSKKLVSTASADANALALLPTGGAVIAGRFGDWPAAATSYLVGLGLDGSQLWSAQLGGKAANGVALQGSSRIWTAGIDKVWSAIPDGQLHRLTLWGQSTCSEAGNCLAPTPADCDDTNQCTVDSCDPKTGCTHTPITTGSCAVGCPSTGSGTDCGNGQGKCENGHCFHTDAKGYKWTLVPAGKFWMGCNAVVNKLCDTSEKPQHEVGLSAFWIGVYEVTAAQYANCTLQAECTSAGSGLYATWGVTGKESHPVNYVDWAQAQVFCKWVGGDLPTEAQWEKAARGGCEVYQGKDCKASMTKYPWGNTTPFCGLHAVYADTGGEKTCGQALSSYAVGVGSVEGASPYGAYDFAGNVWEWTLDWYDSGFYSKSAATASDAWSSTPTFERVFRGGFFGNDATFLRSAKRGFVGPKVASPTVGLRCAKPLQ